MLEKVYRRRKIVVPLFILLMIASFSITPFLKQDLFSAEDFTLFYIDIDLPPGSNPDSTEDLITRYEERLVPLVGNGEIAGVNSFTRNNFV